MMRSDFAYTTQRTSKPVYCKPVVNLTEYTKIRYSRSQKIETPTENVYDTAGYENPKPLCGKKGMYTPNLLNTAAVLPTLGAEVRKN